MNKVDHLFGQKGQHHHLFLMNDSVTRMHVDCLCLTDGQLFGHINCLVYTLRIFVQVNLSSKLVYAAILTRRLSNRNATWMQSRSLFDDRRSHISLANNQSIFFFFFVFFLFFFFFFVLVFFFPVFFHAAHSIRWHCVFEVLKSTHMRTHRQRNTFFALTSHPLPLFSSLQLVDTHSHTHSLSTRTLNKYSFTLAQRLPRLYSNSIHTFSLPLT